MSFLARMVAKSPEFPKNEQRTRQAAIDKLCNRLVHAALLEDRRSAAQAIKAVSKQYQTEIGSIGLEPLLVALKRDSEDDELSRSILEALITILNCDEDAEMPAGLCEMLLKDTATFAILFGLLKEAGQYVKYDVLQLLSTIEEHLSHRLPAAIMATPGALSTIVELLDDTHEIIRNESLLLLQRITESNAEVQRVAAFEGCFEKLLEMVFSEGGVFGGEVIVGDALLIIQNMLRYNPSNQNYFLESPCLGKLKLLLLMPAEDAEESPGGPLPVAAQAAKNFAAATHVINLLLPPESPKRGSVQDALHKTGILQPLLAAAFSGALDSALVQASAMMCIKGLLYQNPSIKSYFSRELVDITDARPAPAVLVAIKIAVNSREELLRRAAVDLLGSYLQGNPDGQLVISATFKSPHLEGSPTPSVEEQSAGSIIIDRIVDLSSTRKDHKRVLFAALLLSHILRDNEQCKMIALQHRLTEDELLIQKILLNLNDAVKDVSPAAVFSAVAYLVLLCTWIYSCPAAGRLFLSEGSNAQFLIELINQNSTVDPAIQGCAAFLFGLLMLFNDNPQGSFSREALEGIVKSRIGTDVFFARITRIRDGLLRLKAGITQELSDEDSCDLAFADLFLSNYQQILSIFSQQGKAHPSAKADAPITGQDQSVETIDLQEESWQVSPNPPPPVSDNRHQKNVESKCAYLISENTRLQKLVDAYATQLMQIEKDHEELLMILASYDNELKQLRQHLTLAEEQNKIDRNVNMPSDVDLVGAQVEDASEDPVPEASIESPVVIASETIPVGQLYTTEVQATRAAKLAPSDEPVDPPQVADEQSPEAPLPQALPPLPLLSPRKPSSTMHEV